MSKQIICDVCGNRVGDYREHWRLSMFRASEQRIFKIGQKDCTLSFEDVCQDCADKIYQSVMSIKTLDNHTSI